MRICFLCAEGSGRALLAASLLQAQDEASWEAWCTPPTEERETLLVEQVLREQRVPLLADKRMIQPAFGTRWDEGIVLCSGTAAT